MQRDEPKKKKRRKYISLAESDEERTKLDDKTNLMC